MTFQISKLNTSKWHLQLKTWVVATVLWLQDLYIDTCALMNRAWIRALVLLVCLIGRFKRPREQIIYATNHKSGADVTLAVKCYYACDKVKSCGSLYRWMAKFGEVDPQINLVLAVDNNIRVARINIDDDFEEITMKPLDTLHLADIPTKQLHQIATDPLEKNMPTPQTIRVLSIRRASKTSGDEMQNDYYQKMCEHDD